MSENIVDEAGKPAVTTSRGDRRAGWAAEARGIRENMRGNYWIQKRQDLLNEAEAILERAQVQGRALTPGEETWFDNVKADVDFCSGRVAAYNEARDAELKKAGMLPSRNGGQEDGLLPESHRARLTHLQQTPGATGRRYADLFPQANNTGGFASGEEFLRLVASGLSDERILKMNAATQIESVPSLGGYVVPEVLSRQWLDSSLESEIVRPRARIYPMVSETLKISGFDISDLSTSSPAGLKAEWAEENSPAVPQVGKFRISGTGTGQPLSILNDPALVTVAKEGGQLGQTIEYANIVKMFARLHPSAINGAVWVASSTTIPQLLSLYIGTGTSGTIMPAVKEGSGNFTLLGMPLLFTEKLPPLGSKGDILLVNFNNYAIGLRKEVVLEKSNAPGWSRDVTSYRVILRADGMGLWNKPQTPKNGDSRSWAVALAARS